MRPHERDSQACADGSPIPSLVGFESQSRLSWRELQKVARRVANYPRPRALWGIHALLFMGACAVLFARDHLGPGLGLTAMMPGIVLAVKRVRFHAQNKALYARQASPRIHVGTHGITVTGEGLLECYGWEDTLGIVDVRDVLVAVFSSPTGGPVVVVPLVDMHFVHTKERVSNAQLREVLSAWAPLMGASQMRERTRADQRRAR